MPDVKPALTPEEWARGENDDEHQIEIREEGPYIIGAGGLGPENCHALAALCLHEQLFGFTRDDLAALQRVLQSGLCWEIDANWGCGHLRSLTDRISALLPPEDAK